MAKKGSKAANGGRRSSMVTTPELENKNITIVNHNETDHSKFSVIRSGQQDSLATAKEMKHWAELKKENTTTEEIRNAVRRLPLDNVLPLLQELLAEFDVQQARDTVLTEWIKTVLLIHTAYFMTLPEVVQRLSTLYKELNDRLTVYPKLLAMRGRLDLIQNQIDARNRKEEETEDEDDLPEQAYSESEDDMDDEGEDDEGDDENDEDLMDMDNEEVEMFQEEEDDLNTEDEDDNISDSDIED